MDSVDPHLTSPTSFKKIDRDRESPNSNKLYVGNLPPYASEILLRNFMDHHSGGVSSIVIKNGYGFIECTDQASADIIIDTYQGRCFLGNKLAVEPALGGPRTRTNFKSIPRMIQSQYPQRMMIPEPSTSYLFIPSEFVGAIIGNKGLTIRNMIRESGASLKIENIMTDAPADNITERRVTIFGPVEANWRAQYLIFQKLTEDGRLPHDVRLRLEILVPSEMIGRLIGRAGSRIKEIQADTGATIKFLTEEGRWNSLEETFAQMFGTYHSLFNAQMEIRQIIHAAHHNRRNFMLRGNPDYHSQVGSGGQFGQWEREHRQSGREELKAVTRTAEQEQTKNASSNNLSKAPEQ